MDISKPIREYGSIADRGMPEHASKMLQNAAHEQQVSYQQHRQRVRHAKSIVNSQAPQRRAKQDLPKELSYIEMLSLLRGRLKHKFPVRTFTNSPETTRPHRPYIKPQSDSDNPKNRDRSTPRRQHAHCIPPHVLQRYESMSLPHDGHMMRRLLRPRIYMDLEVKHVRPLGRLIIQLYTEACPEVVLEFVRACLQRSKERFHFTRLLPPLWIEGELALADGTSLTTPGIEHNHNVVDHGSGADVLSFPSRYVRGSKRRRLNFSISFKPISPVNGKRVAFGKVRRGYWILDTIQDYGTTSKKQLKQIIVSKCGVLS